MESTEREKFVARLPLGMRDRVFRQAQANRRSMNSQIVHYLDRALADEEAKGPAGTAIPPSHDQNHPSQKDGGNDA